MTPSPRYVAMSTRLPAARRLSVQVGPSAVRHDRRRKPYRAHVRNVGRRDVVSRQPQDAAILGIDVRRDRRKANFRIRLASCLDVNVADNATQVPKVVLNTARASRSARRSTAPRSSLIHK